MLVLKGELVEASVYTAGNGREYGRAQVCDGVSVQNCDVPADAVPQLELGKGVEWPVVMRVVTPKAGGTPFAALRAVRV